MFYQAHSLEEALHLKSHHEGAIFIAGGTDLIVMRNHGRLKANNFIDISCLPKFDEVEKSTGGKRWRATGGATFARLGKLPVRCLAEAAMSVGGPQIRNRATIGGNLFSASPAADGATALLALDASVEMTSLNGTRTLPLSQFFLDYRKTALAPDEIISAVEFPADWTSAWLKLGKRGAMNISLVCCAVGLSPTGEVRVAFGSVAPYPLLTPHTAQFIEESGMLTGPVPPDEKVLTEAARLAAEEVRPVDDFRGSADYRRAMAGALLVKCLRKLTDGKSSPK